MATEEEISTLKRKRCGLKAKLTLFKTFVEQTTNKSVLNDVDLIELDQRINRIDPLLEDFDRVQEALEFTTNNHEEQLAERESFESSFFAVTAIAKGLLSKARASITSGENNVASDNVSVRSVGNIQIVKMKKCESTPNESSSPETDDNIILRKQGFCRLRGIEKYISRIYRADVDMLIVARVLSKKKNKAQNEQSHTVNANILQNLLF
ncbi:hypothetical protein JTB14_013333 [Gonioctena quinquepunctata]|nr:hypothetical protein JTB14_013333 [Gonioctena quinquepunctata]